MSLCWLHSGSSTETQELLRCLIYVCACCEGMVSSGSGPQWHTVGWVVDHVYCAVLQTVRDTVVLVVHHAASHIGSSRTHRLVSHSVFHWAGGGEEQNKSCIDWCLPVTCVGLITWTGWSGCCTVLPIPMTVGVGQPNRAWHVKCYKESDFNSVSNKPTLVCTVCCCQEPSLCHYLTREQFFWGVQQLSCKNSHNMPHWLL